MTSTNRQADLFGRPQSDLFDGTQPAAVTHDRMAELTRPRLEALLAEARRANRMPWDAQKAEVNALIFHNMANWLPEPERESLRAAFQAELTRLRDAG